MKHLKSFEDIRLTLEDDGGGGAAMVNAGTTMGMGDVVSSQPSTAIGSTIGSNTIGGTYGGDGKVGSGDIGMPLINTFTPKQKKAEKKRQKDMSAFMAKYSGKIAAPKVMDYQSFLKDTNNLS